MAVPVRERRPTGWSPSVMNWPTGYKRDRVSDDEARSMPTLGSLDYCWCGEPMNHDWERKAEGEPHPR